MVPEELDAEREGVAVGFSTGSNVLRHHVNVVEPVMN